MGSDSPTSTRSRPLVADGTFHVGCSAHSSGARFLRVVASGKGFLVAEAGEFSEMPTEAIASGCTVVMPHGQVHSQRLMGPGEQGQRLRDLARDVAARQFDSVETVHDAQALPGGGAWVSLAREADASSVLAACQVPQQFVSRLVGLDVALATAFSAIGGQAPAVLLDIGSEVCQIVVLGESGIVLSADAEPGTDALLAALAADLAISHAEVRTRLAAAASLPLRTPRTDALLSRLLQDVDSILRDHAREAGVDPAKFLAAPLHVSGTLPALAGWPTLARRAFGERLTAGWPSVPSLSQGRIEVTASLPAFGAALIGLGFAGSPPNLAPSPARRTRRAWIRTGRIQAAACALAVLALALVITDLVSRSHALTQRQAEVAVLASAAAKAPAIGKERDARDEAYRGALPSLYLHKRTRDFVSGLRLLQARGNSTDHWFALVADLETYQAGSLPQGTPASAPELQVLFGTLGRTSGLVAEIGFRPGATDPLAQVGSIIREIGSAGQFKEVDLLPARARQPLADKSVFAADGSDFAVRMVAAPFEHSLPPPVLRRETPALFSQSR